MCVFKISIWGWGRGAAGSVAPIFGLLASASILRACIGQTVLGLLMPRSLRKQASPKLSKSLPVDTALSQKIRICTSTVVRV